MARINITVEDIGNNKVRITSEPNFETMMKMNLSGEALTSAHGYALAMLNIAREESKKNAPHRILVPKVGGL